VHPGDAHRLVQDTGPGDNHVAVLKNLAADRLRALFGVLHTEEFYDARRRYEQSRTALEALRAALGPRFIDVVDVQVQDVAFDPKYDEKIKEKKLADQNAEFSKSEALANKENAHVNEIKIQTETQKKVIVAKRPPKPPTRPPRRTSTARRPRRPPTSTATSRSRRATSRRRRRTPR
jgi:regulator of protease activity HflC (stomatin/prohibitin superfamily)